MSAGGIPGWVTALNASIRVDDPVWNAAYRPYWDRMAEIAARNEVDAGGMVILVQVENGEKPCSAQMLVANDLRTTEYVIDADGMCGGELCRRRWLKAAWSCRECRREVYRRS